MYVRHVFEFFNSMYNMKQTRHRENIYKSKKGLKEVFPQKKKKKKNNN